MSNWCEQDYRPNGAVGMNLTCYQIQDDAPELIPARSARTWMDATGHRFAYRCTPLTMANSTGWELICPFSITASWNGGPGLGDLVIERDGPDRNLQHVVQSAFGHGILTFHPGYVFRTDPEWGIWCRGSPNFPKDGIVALDGLVETDWLPFTFTMNWLFTRPGTVRFEKGEPFCFILPLPHMNLEAIQPKILPLSENPELQAENAAWAASRRDFNKRLSEGDPTTTKEKWQRFYLTGKSPKGAVAPDTHRVKRKMAEAKGAKPKAEHTSTAKEHTSAAKREPAQPTQAPGRVAQHIIWIASYPKSGNTWIRAIIHNLLRELSGDANGVQDINRLHEHTVWEIPAPGFEKILGKPIAQANHAEIARARPEVQRDLANGRPAPFFVKTHLCFGNDFQYPTINLDATLAAICVVRNPLDVAISYSRHSGQTIDATIIHMATPGLKTTGNERNVHEVIGSWSQHVASWMGMTGRPVHLVRYEDLLASPERNFALLARFLRLAPSKEQLQRAVAKSSFTELSRQEKEHGFNERPATAQQFFREGRSGQWRGALSQQQVEEICRVHSPVMQRFGYLVPDCGLSLPLTKSQRSPSASLVETEVPG